MDNAPFVCLIHREDPVVTKCGHCFCMACAIIRYKKTPNCIGCGTEMMGIFNRAKDFEMKLDAKRKRREEKDDKGGVDELVEASDWLPVYMPVSSL